MSAALIKSAYKILRDLTPLKSDCGRLCDKACCISDGIVLLFPGEYELLKHQDYKFSKVELDGFGEVYLIMCSGICNRDYRPLSCRIFPLTLSFNKGDISVKLDARGRHVCKLAHKSILSLDKEFLRAVKKVLIMLYRDDNISKYLDAISKIEDKYTKIIP